jgi:hypothetical protein
VAEEAGVAYNNSPDGPGAGSGGIFLWVSPHTKHLVTKTGRSRIGRTQWMRLSGTTRGDVAILNVYAPNVAAARCELWEELIDILSKNC